MATIISVSAVFSRSPLTRSAIAYRSGAETMGVNQSAGRILTVCQKLGVFRRLFRKRSAPPALVLYEY